MSIEELILQVRFKVGDFVVDSPVFADSYYTMEINSAVYKYNPKYTVATLPDEEVFLVVLLASVQMCLARAAMQASTGSSPGISNEDIKKLGFDGISAELYDPMKVTTYWINLAKEYQEDYEIAVRSSGANLTQISNETMIKIDRDTLKKIPSEGYKQATPSILTAASIKDTSLSIQWTMNTNSDFYKYMLYQRQDGVDTLLLEELDRKRVSFLVEDLTLDTAYTFVMYIWNTASTEKNVYNSISNVLSVTTTGA